MKIPVTLALDKQVFLKQISEKKNEARLQWYHIRYIASEVYMVLEL